MRKIPTVFQRIGTGRGAQLSTLPHPECGWVLAGEGVPTRKYDGTCVALDGDNGWQARRVVKQGPDPDGFQLVEEDPNTGFRVGWEPIRNSGFYRWFEDAFWNDVRSEGIMGGFAPGTYELIGPKINGNPERRYSHWLIRHGDTRLPDITPRTFDALKPYILQLGEQGIEGVVWYHPDGRMAKLKAKDFR